MHHYSPITCMMILRSLGLISTYIASYDPKNKTLVEYYIPSQNPLWVNSSNPLTFIFDNKGSILFTEWTENN